jgi:hypothetical protein
MPNYELADNGQFDVIEEHLNPWKFPCILFRRLNSLFHNLNANDFLATGTSICAIYLLCYINQRLAYLYLTKYSLAIE